MVSAAGPYAATSTDRQKIRVNDPAVAAEIERGGGRLIADYGGFRLIEANQTALRKHSGPALEASAEEDTIFLNSRRVDASTKPLRTKKTFAGKRLHLVHFDGPVKPEWAGRLSAAGARIVTYVPNNTYLVYGDASSLETIGGQVQSGGAMLWEGEYTGDDRLQPKAKALQARNGFQPAANDLFAVQLVEDREANRATLQLIDALKVEPAMREQRVLGYVNLIVRLPIDQILSLAGQPDVVSISPYAVPTRFCERQDQIVAGNLDASGSVPTNAGYLAWIYSMGFTQDQFTASGFAVDVTDSGVDNGTAVPNHFGLYVRGDTGLASRVVYNRLEGTANSGSTIQGCDGHGNLNAHIIAGFNDLNGFPHADAAGFRYGLGVCPFVKVGSSVIFDPDNYTYPNFSDLISRAYRDGARISSDSWGSSTYGGYDTDSQEYDALVRDAQPASSAVPSNGNQEMTIVFAAGNKGPNAQTVGSPGTAKNVITVGAAENVQAFGGADGSGVSDTGADSANDIIYFSSRGPCTDGRRKPEIVAPGTHVSGGVGQQTRTVTGTGTALSCFNGSGVSGGVGSSFFPTGQQFYSASSGTSHSTPGVAGGCALIRQYFINQGWAVPSPAMVKAFLVIAARYLTGVSADDTLWSNNQGMGMMNLGFVFDGVPRILRDQRTNDVFTAAGQSRVLTGRVVTNGKPVRVTLTWTDAPGSTIGNSYNNDLDLVVGAGGQTYYGNVFSGSNSATGGSRDVRNNTESVFLPVGTTGAVVITVRASNINSDGVPNYGGALDQDFALVAYNVEEASLPVIVSAGGGMASESCAITNEAIDPDEFVTVLFALRNDGSADTTNVVATLETSGGVVDPSGPMSYGALLAGGSAATNAFTFTATGICGSNLTATLSLVDGATDLGSVAYSFTLGSRSNSVTTNSNGSAITIIDYSVASPYPSTINVSGVSGTISKVTASLLGFSHTYPWDIDVLLVGPDGHKVALMGAAGGSLNADNVNITFDDDAVESIGEPIVSGTYKPTGSIASMPSPAPSAPFDSELAVFNGSSPNGAWSLYIVDAASGDSGSVSGGWRVTITAGEPVCCASNQPPILSPIGAKDVTEGHALEFAVSAIDPVDGNDVTLGASNLPPGAVFNTVTNALVATNTFRWDAAAPAGVYTTLFYAVDKDGMDTEAITITVYEGCDGGTKLIDEDFDASTSVPAGWTNGGTANDTRASHYQSAPNCRNFSLGTWLMTPAVDYPTQVVFYVDATSGGNGRTTTIDYSVDGGPFVSLGGFVVSTAGSNVVFKVDSSPNLSFSQRVRFRFNSPFSTWYLDDVRVTGGCPGGGSGVPPVLLPIGNRSVAQDGTLQFEVSAAPTESDPVTLTASNLPAGAVFNATNENGTFTWTGAAPAGVYTSSFHAVDNDGMDSETITITVENNDSNGNGIPDDWEQRYFGNLTNTAAGDNDGDRSSNLDEYIADTNPTNAASFFAIESFARTAGREVQILSTNSRYYSVDYLPDMIAGDTWSNLQSGVAGSNGLLSIMDTNEAVRRMYRARVNLP